MVSRSRAAHVERVVALLDHWAAAIGLDDAEALRWRQAGWLHDAYRDAPGKLLRQLTSLDAPPGFLHGPAAAARAAADGYDDVEVLDAVRWHTVGSVDWGDVGLALFAADFLEPGRKFATRKRARLSERFPAERDAVIRKVIAMRVERALDSGRSLRPRTVAFQKAWCG